MGAKAAVGEWTVYMDEKITISSDIVLANKCQFLNPKFPLPEFEVC